MKDNFDLEVKKILKQAESEMFSLNHPYVGSEHMLLAILKISSLKDLLGDFSLTYESFKDELISIVGVSHKKSELALYTPLLKRIISDAIDEAEETAEKVVKPEHLLIGMLEEGEGVGIRILMNMNVDLESIYNELIHRNSKGHQNKSSILYDIGKLMGTKTDDRVYKREREISTLIEVLLRKDKNNPLLLGEAGVGKTAIVEEFARMIEQGEVPDSLQDYKVVELDTGSLISGTRYRGEFEDRLNKIIKEVCNSKNIILFIDEIHTLVNCGGAEGAIDAANILKPYMARGSIKIIGATTLKEYRNTIYKDKALDRRFQIINVEEPSIKDTEYILKNVKRNYENHHNVIISDANIKDILKYSEKYIYNRFNPDKAIDILDSVCAHAQLSRPNKKNALSELYKKKEKFLKNKKYKEALEIELCIKDMTEHTNKIEITASDIRKVVEYKANIPVLDEWGKDIVKLPSIIKSHLFGQDEAIDRICNSLKEKYLSGNTKPLSILLNGPSGVGKTYLAKEIANNLFGTKRFLRLDMSELTNETAINRLLGSPQGYVGYEDDCLLAKTKEYPYSLILLDEIEKSSTKIQSLFQNILENGQIVTNKGETLHFENSTFILTSNTHTQEVIGFNGESNEKKTNTYDELASRVGEIITLAKIDSTIARKYIKRESSNLHLTKADIDTIIEASHFDTQGFRGLQKELNKYKISKLLSKV